MSKQGGEGGEWRRLKNTETSVSFPYHVGVSFSPCHPIPPRVRQQTTCSPVKQKKNSPSPCPPPKEMIVSIVLVYMVVVWNMGEAANCACFNTVGPVVLGSAVNETDCQVGVCGSFAGHMFAPTWVGQSGFYCSSPDFPPPFSPPGTVLPVLRLNDTHMTYGMSVGPNNNIGGTEGPMIAFGTRRFLHGSANGAQLVDTTIPSSSLVPESVPLSPCVPEAVRSASPNCLVYGPNTALLGALSETGCAQHGAWAGHAGSLFQPPITGPLGSGSYPLCFDHPVFASVDVFNYDIIDSNDVPRLYNRAVIRDAQCALVNDSLIWFGVSTFSSLLSGDVYGAYLLNAADPLDVTKINITVVGPITPTGGMAASTFTSRPCGGCPAAPVSPSPGGGAALVGAAVGVVILVGCIGGCVWFCIRQRKKGEKATRDDVPTMHTTL